MHEFEKKARELIGKKFGDRIVYDIVYKSRISKNKVRSDWFFLSRCSKNHESCLRKVDLIESTCIKCYIPHNKQHNFRGTKEYNIWKAMRQRCLNAKCKDYKYYGARGIKICKRWDIFMNFYEDMGPKPEGLSLDRIDNNGDYEPNNCRWVTQKEQVLNSRTCLK